MMASVARSCLDITGACSPGGDKLTLPQLISFNRLQWCARVRANLPVFPFSQAAYLLLVGAFRLQALLHLCHLLRRYAGIDGIDA